MWNLLTHNKYNCVTLYAESGQAQYIALYIVWVAICLLWAFVEYYLYHNNALLYLSTNNKQRYLSYKVLGPCFDSQSVLLSHEMNFVLKNGSGSKSLTTRITMKNIFSVVVSNLPPDCLPWVLKYRHNEHDGVSNHWRLDCLLNRLFRRRSNKTSKLRVTGLGKGNPPVTGGFPTQRASNTEMFPFDKVIMVYPETVICMQKWYGTHIVYLPV